VVDYNQFYRLDDIFFMAMKIEKNGEEFYKSLAKRTKNDKIRDSFSSLSGEEKKHRSAVLDLYSDFKMETKGSYDNFLEKVSHLMSIANNNIFLQAQLSEVLGGVQNEDELLDYAIRIEEDTIRFYKELQKSVDERCSLAIDSLIEEEQKHKQDLLQLKEGIEA
jgi:rubrerythrin